MWQHLFNSLDAFQIGRIMGRSKNGKTLDRRLYLRRDICTFSILLTPMHDAVTDYINLRWSLDYPVLSAPEGSQHMLNDRFSLIHRNVFLHHLALTRLDRDFCN